MPIIKSAVKRVRQTKSATARNNVARRRLKDAKTQLEAALESSAKKDLMTLLSKLQSQLDLAVKKSLMHKNKAARLKQHYAARVKQAGGKPAQAIKKAAKKAKPAPKKTAAKTKKASPAKR